MSKNSTVRALTKPNMSKVRAKILNTMKHVEAQPNNAVAAANLSRLQAKYPNALSSEA